jgi:hypothetical protein
MMLTLQGLLRLWTGSSTTAVGPAEQALERFRAMGDWYGQLLATGVLGRSLIAQGRFDEGFAVIDESAAVADATTSSAAPDIAYTHVVTAAAQAGQPERTWRVPVRFTVEDVEEPAIGFTDCLVGQGLLHLQVGEISRGRAVLERVVAAAGVAASGYALSAVALARGADGEVAGALEAAGQLERHSSVTYSDRVTAGLARALVSARVGDASGADAALRDVQAVLEPTDERHGRNLLSLAAATVDRALGRDVAAGAGVEAATASPGWATAFRLVAGLAETGTGDQVDGSFT